MKLMKTTFYVAVMLWVMYSLVTLIGCATGTGQRLDPNYFYKRDMGLQVNGKVVRGAMVVPENVGYNFKVTSPGDMDLFTLTTCHREIAHEKVGKKTNFRIGRMAGIENKGSCPVRLAGYDKDRGKHSWGFVDFRSHNETLWAFLKCNGSVRSAQGVSVCQSRAGLIQEIRFPVPVDYVENKQCPDMKSEDGKTFQYKMPKGLCVYAFKEKGPKGRNHRHTTLGYERILIRQ